MLSGGSSTQSAAHHDSKRVAIVFVAERKQLVNCRLRRVTDLLNHDQVVAVDDLKIGCDVI